VKFFIDGVQVSANGAVAFAATGANAVLQPYLAMYKPSGTGIGTLTVDPVDEDGAILRVVYDRTGAREIRAGRLPERRPANRATPV
jgi:hypothetical protein